MISFLEIFAILTLILIVIFIFNYSTFKEIVHREISGSYKDSINNNNFVNLTNDNIPFIDKNGSYNIIVEFGNDMGHYWPIVLTKEIRDKSYGFVYDKIVSESFNHIKYDKDYTSYTDTKDNITIMLFTPLIKEKRVKTVICGKNVNLIIKLT